jgi:hypothetical protein
VLVDETLVRRLNETENLKIYFRSIPEATVTYRDVGIVESRQVYDFDWERFLSSLR